jgi:hypothetical protein
MLFIKPGQGQVLRVIELTMHSSRGLQERAFLTVSSRFHSGMGASCRGRATGIIEERIGEPVISWCKGHIRPSKVKMLGTRSRYATKPDCGFDCRAEGLRNRPPAGRCEGRKPASDGSSSACASCVPHCRPCLSNRRLLPAKLTGLLPNAVAEMVYSLAIVFFRREGSAS